MRKTARRAAAAPDMEAIAAKVAQNPIARAVLDAADALLLIINDRRQILASNLSRYPSVKVPKALVGLKPGEALGCDRAQVSRSGCGGSVACRSCGANRALKKVQAGEESAEGELLITVGEGSDAESREFHVRATGVTVEGERYSVLSLRDISAEKRREVLEQVFLHDMLNTLTGLHGWTEQLRRKTNGEAEKATDRIAFLSALLERDLRDYRSLLLAEQGVLEPQMETLGAGEVLEMLEAIVAPQDIARGRVLETTPPSPPFEIVTEGSILLRILTNMVKNALEAAAPGGTVRVWCERLDGENAAAAFHVWNREWIPPDVATRIFQRSFTTRRGPGRGLGTYSMKVLGERVLKGEVSFRTHRDEGTTFTLRLPPAARAPLPDA